MKNRKIIVFLLLAVAALVAAEIAMGILGQKSRLASRTALVENATDAMSVTLLRRDEVPTRLDLVDGVWQMTRPFVARVEQSVVLRLLDVLSQTPVQDAITELELLKLGRTRADYSLDDPPLRIVVSNALSSAALSFGTMMPSGDGVYAAMDGVRSVLILPLSVMEAVDLPVDRLRLRRLFDYGENSIVSFTIRQAPGSILAFAREGDGWRIGTDKATTSRVTEFLETATAVTAQKFVWPTGATNESAQASTALLAGYGLDPETAITLTLKRAGGQSASISLGRAAGEKDAVYALVHNGGAVVMVSSALKDAAKRGAAWFTDSRLFRIAAEKVETISLSDDAMCVSLSRVGEGAWRLDAPIAAAADTAAVAELLKRVMALTAADLVAEGVAVSLGGDAKPIIVSRSSIFQTSGGLENLRAKEIVDFSDDEVRRLRSQRDDSGDATVVYSKDRQAWNVETAQDGAVVSEDGVKCVLAALSPLKAERVVKLKVAADELADYGLDKPVLTLAVDLDRANGVRRNILVGAETPDGRRYATVGSADAVFVLSREAFESLSRSLVR